MSELCKNQMEGLLVSTIKNFNRYLLYSESERSVSIGKIRTEVRLTIRLWKVKSTNNITNEKP